MENTAVPPVIDAAPAVERIALTTKETLAALQISETSLWRLGRAGLLMPMPGLRHKRYAVAAIKRFADSAN
jgi:hypothetical protein